MVSGTGVARCHPIIILLPVDTSTRRKGGEEVDSEEVCIELECIEFPRSSQSACEKLDTLPTNTTTKLLGRHRGSGRGWTYRQSTLVLEHCS